MFVFVVVKSTPLSVEREALNNPDMFVSNTNASREIIVQQACRLNDEAIAVESILHPPDSSVDIALNSGSVILRESADESSSLARDEKVSTISASSAWYALELDVQKIPEKMTECPNAISEITTTLPDKTSVECNFVLDHHNICGEERKSSTFSQIGSDASNCEEKPTHATEEGKDAVEYEQKIEAKYFKHDCGSLTEGDFHCTAESLEHSLNVNVVHGVHGSGDCTMSSDAEYRIQIQNSHDGITNGTCSSPQRRQKLAQDSDTPSLGNGIPNISSGKDAVTICKPEYVALCGMKQLPCSADPFSNSITGPNSHASCISSSKCSNLQSGVDNDIIAEGNSSSFTFPVGVTHDTSSKAIHDLKDDIVVAESNSGSFNANTIPVQTQFCSKPFQQSESGSQVDLSIVSPDDCEHSATQAAVLV